MIPAVAFDHPPQQRVLRKVPGVEARIVDEERQKHREQAGWDDGQVSAGHGRAQ